LSLAFGTATARFICYVQVGPLEESTMFRRVALAVVFLATLGITELASFGQYYYDPTPPRRGYAYPGAPYYPGYGPPYYSGFGPPYYSVITLDTARRTIQVTAHRTLRA
jgi:hypothetical protein